MKPLLNVEKFLKRFNNFKDGELRSIEIISPTQMKVTLAGQDEARAYDWISVVLEFSGITDAKLLKDSVMSLIDMSEGISIINNNNSLAFALGECYNISSIKSAISFIEFSDLKYQENLF